MSTTPDRTTRTALVRHHRATGRPRSRRDVQLAAAIRVEVAVRRHLEMR